MNAPEPGSRAFWAGKKVLITGHTGFKGAWLCRWLLRAGATVTGYALPAPTTPALFELLQLGRHVEHWEHDVRDLDALRRCVETTEPEFAFHLAAQTIVGESYRSPVATFATNVLGTVNVLEAIRPASELRACVVVTSDKCYADEDPRRAHREDDPLGGSDPYSASKACAELVTTAYRRSFAGAARIASARAGNVIGGGDWAPDRLVPDIVRALTTETPLELRRPEAVRPWQHVLDPLAGYLILAERLAEDESLQGAWNFGPSDVERLTVRDVAAEFIERWGTAAGTSIRLVPPSFSEADYLALDSTKARLELQAAPRWGAREAISRAAEWYSALYLGGSPAETLVDLDLDAYAAAEPRGAAGSLRGSAH